MPDPSPENMSLTLAALIGSRICHDLISPIGAINNGLELMAMGAQSGGPELELITQSVESANARIRFFRVAYGMANADQMVSGGEITSILDGIYGEGRLSINWMPNDAVKRSVVQTVFLALQCLETCLPYGGTITVSQDGTGCCVEAEGSKIRDDAALWSALDAAPDAEVKLPPGEVQFALLPLVLARHGKTLQHSHDATRATLRF